MPRYYFKETQQDLAQERILLEREGNKGRGAYRLRDELDKGYAWLYADTLEEVLDEAQEIRKARKLSGLDVVRGVICVGDPNGRDQVQVIGQADGRRVGLSVSVQARDWDTVLAILERALDKEIQVDRVRAV